MMELTADVLVAVMVSCVGIALLFVIMMNLWPDNAPDDERVPTLRSPPDPEAAEPQWPIERSSSAGIATARQLSTALFEPTAAPATVTADGSPPPSNSESQSQPPAIAPLDGPRPFNGPSFQPRPPALEPEANSTVTAGFAAPFPPPLQSLVKRKPDYERNAGLAGFLYVARNNSHRAGVYKLGQTTLEPQERINALNRQLVAAADLGEFHLVHASAVRDAHGQEQQLFEVLQERRIAVSREYFFSDAAVLRRATDAVALLPVDGGAAIEAFRTSTEWINAPHRPTPTLPVCVVPARLGEDGGWIYVLQNFWHEPGTAILSVTKKSEAAILGEINEAQRTLTSQLGFYQVVACAAVPSTQAALGVAERLFEPLRLPHRRRFVRADLSTLRDLVERARVEAEAAPEPPFTGSTAPKPPPRNRPPDPDREFLPAGRSGDINVSLLPGPASGSFSRWTTKCRGCGSRLRFTGAIGAKAKVKCPVDGCSSPSRLVWLGASRMKFLD